jgi:acetate kinase
VNVLTLNSGSGTLKAAWAEVRDGHVRVQRRVTRDARSVGSHELVMQCLEALALDGAPDAVAHRVVHGGDSFVVPVRVDATVEIKLRQLVPLAPLHLPPALDVIRSAQRQFPAQPHVAVFDTAFHASRALESHLYALPPAIAQAHGIRRYGFHGIAHASLLQSLAHALGQPVAQVSAVTLQLGSGCSACAIREGRSIETSMGFTPLEGLVMATRCGDLDAGAVLHLLRRGQDVDAIEDLLMRRSGLLGLGGSSDTRELLSAEASGNTWAAAALRVFVRRIVLAIGGYWTLLGGEGALVFGGGIGENSAEIRTRVVAELAAWNVALDAARNSAGEPGCISAAGARPVYVFATDEESVLAHETARCLASQ